MSYAAVVTRVSVRPHPNAERLALGVCQGNQVVVGLDTAEGSLGVFFPTDGVLSEEYVVANELYNKSAMDTLGLTYTDDHKFGFFSTKRRVHSQKFRGERSDGIFMPLESLGWTGADPNGLKEGDAFTEWGGYGICDKYYTPATLRALAGGKKLARRDALCFPKHDDTKQFRFVADTIPDDAVIYISEKLHGTSGRVGLVWDEVPRTGLPRAINRYLARLGVEPPFLPTPGWVYLNGSKNVILEKATDKEGWYGTNQFREDVVEGLTLHKGEILYYEIVGWVNETTPIMPPHKVEKGQLKEIQAQYGDTIAYDYSCAPGERRIYVYKIVHVNEDGVARELPWSQVVSRCSELGLSHVPLLYGPTTLAALALEYADCIEGTLILPPEHEALRKKVEQLTEGSSTLNPKSIREGVVIRTESEYGISHIKNKSFEFGVMEGYIKQEDTYVDTEEIA